MAVIKSGDLVVLKSGGPTMTVDTVNTDIFDDNKITGILCVWFVGEKLQRVRFDHMAIEPLRSQPKSPRKKPARAVDAADEYKQVLDQMVSAMNHPAEEDKDAPGHLPEPSTPTSPKPHDPLPAAPLVTGVAISTIKH